MKSLNRSAEQREKGVAFYTLSATTSYEVYSVDGKVWIDARDITSEQKIPMPDVKAIGDAVRKILFLEDAS